MKKEVVIKLVKGGKSRSLPSLLSQLAYIGRKGEADLFIPDWPSEAETGCPMPMSREASSRQKHVENAFCPSGAKGTYAHHMVVSIPFFSPTTRMSVIQANKSLFEFLRENFNDRSMLVAIHSDQEGAAGGRQQHWHVLIAHEGQFGSKDLAVPSRNFNPQKIDLHQLRESLVACCARNGISFVSATRREDRTEVLNGIAEGTSVLRPKFSRGVKRSEGRVLGELLATSPQWFSRWGVHTLARFVDEDKLLFRLHSQKMLRLPSTRDTVARDRRHVPPSIESTFADLQERVFAKIFRKPKQGFLSFIDLACENEDLAFWLLENQPKYLEKEQLATAKKGGFRIHREDIKKLRDCIKVCREEGFSSMPADQLALFSKDIGVCQECVRKIEFAQDARRRTKGINRIATITNNGKIKEGSLLSLQHLAKRSFEVLSSRSRQ